MRAPFLGPFRLQTSQRAGHPRHHAHGRGRTAYGPACGRLPAPAVGTGRRQRRRRPSAAAAAAQNAPTSVSQTAGPSRRPVQGGRPVPSWSASHLILTSRMRFSWSAHLIVHFNVFLIPLPI